jgi:hypothetical protein
VTDQDLTDIGLAHPFLRPGKADAVEPRKKLASWALVAAVHAAIFFSFVLSVHFIGDRQRPLAELMLLLPQSGNHSTQMRTINPEVDANADAMISSGPITLPKVPPPDFEVARPGATPGDILGAVGQNLACSAGNWEHLTGPERANCRREPWIARKLPNGNLVMVPASQLPRLKEPPPDGAFTFNTGGDRILHDLHTGQTAGQGGCPILQQMPCLHPSSGDGASIGTGN